MIKTYIETRYFDPYAVPFYVEDLSGNGGTLTVVPSYSDATNVEYSTDGRNWTTPVYNTYFQTTIPANGKVYLRANATYWHTGGSYGSSKIKSNKHFSVGGNIMSLLYYQDFKNKTAFPNANYIFFELFCNNFNLTSAEHLLLPATTLAQGCYTKMFRGCTSLTAAPVLPATTLADSCYSEMFSRTALTAAPVLPATTLADSCYSEMFSGCTSLTAAPELPATTLINYCYNRMFAGCTSLTAAPILPAATLASNCYNRMFAGCTSLTAAPELPATYIPWNNSNYVAMFSGCTSLSSVTVGATNWETTSTRDWLNGVAATGTFTKPSATNIPEGVDGIPSGWTVINQ